MKNIFPFQTKLRGQSTEDHSFFHAGQTETQTPAGRIIFFELAEGRRITSIEVNWTRQTRSRNCACEWVTRMAPTKTCFKGSRRNDGLRRAQTDRTARTKGSKFGRGRNLRAYCEKNRNSSKGKNFCFWVPRKSPRRWSTVAHRRKEEPNGSRDISEEAMSQHTNLWPEYSSGCQGQCSRIFWGH